MSKEALKREIKNSTKENLRKELKNTELSVKDKELQVVYEELESVCKMGDKWEDSDNSVVLDPKKEEEINKRYEVAMQYLTDNFSKDFLKNSKVRPGPVFSEWVRGDVVKYLEIYRSDLKNSLIEPLIDNPSLRDIELRKQAQERDFKEFSDKSMEKVELSPYTQRLQKMIKERTGR